MADGISRRALLRAGLGGTALAAAASVAVATGAVSVPEFLSRHWVDDGPDGVVPSTPAGDERVESRRSLERVQAVDFYTAVPAGHGDGEGLPICLVLHGASATAADFPRLGLGRFLSQAVARGAAPFALAGADGGLLRWERFGGDDPQRMVRDEIPRWCAERGFDTTRMAAWGWSMGGYGVLRLAQTYPGFLRAAAAFSPALSVGDPVFDAVGALRGTKLGLWCGRQDSFYNSVAALRRALPERPAAGGYAPGGHSRRYWNRITPAAFDFLAGVLARP
ncbi:MAG: alpha/beta hydrolase-fold protein [Acidimicrobiia bacterium]